MPYQMNAFIFDIETVPDIQTGRQMLGLHDLPDQSVADAMMSLAKESNSTGFIKLQWQKIVAISIVFRYQDQLKIWSLGEMEADEKELITRFFAGIDKYRPTLVSWNGSGFDLPVLHYRALLHGVSSKTYWDIGEFDNSSKYNNYLGRYHTRHIDLMDYLAAYNAKSFAKLDDIANLIGLPGKMGLDGSLVAQAYFNGQIKQIRDYCEIDVLNTYLVYLRFQLIRGQLSEAQYLQEIKIVEQHLHDSTNEHFHEFLQNWHQNRDKISL